MRSVLRSEFLSVLVLPVAFMDLRQSALLWRVSSDWQPLLGTGPLVSVTYQLPQRAFSFSEFLPLAWYISRLLLCVALWDSVLESLGVGPFFHPVRGPFILQAPWREGFGGCRSQGCHGYPSRSARSYSWPHLPGFRHHSPSLSIVMSLNVATCNLG